MMKFKYVLCALALGYLSACTNELIAGSTYSPDDKNIYVDAIGAQARFGLIVAIGVDSQDNVYVADQGNARIRKIAPNHQVSTLAGTHLVQTQFPDQAEPLNTQLVDLGGLTVYDDTLYFTVKGCIRSIDLIQPEAERKINTFYGKCLSEQEKEKTTQDYLDEGLKPEYLSALENLKLSAFGILKHDPVGNLYVIAKSIYQFNDKYVDALSLHRLNEKMQISSKSGISRNGMFDVDSKGCIYSRTPRGYLSTDIVGFSWCEHSKDLPQFIEQNEFYLRNPYVVLIGKQDTIFIFSRWLAKKEVNGQFKLMGVLPSLQGELHVLNSSETILYSADSQQVYRLVLPR